MEFSIGKPAKGQAGTAGIEPALAALETAVLPLNYVPEGNSGKEKPPVRCPWGRLLSIALRRYTGTRPVPEAYEMPRQQDMATRLGRDHGFRFAWNLSACTVFASLCSRVVLMSLTIRTPTKKSNIFIPLFLREPPLSPAGQRANGPTAGETTAQRPDTRGRGSICV
jgi:hypothetical protein